MASPAAGFLWATIWLSALVCAELVNAQNVNTPGGSTNAVAKFSGPNTIVNSLLADNGSTVSISGSTFGFPGAPPLFQLNATWGAAMTATTGPYTAISGTTTSGWGVTGLATAAQGQGVFGDDNSGAQYAIGVDGATVNGIGVQGYANKYGWGAAIDSPYGGTGQSRRSTIQLSSARVAWMLKKKDIQRDLPGITQRKFLYNLSKASYEKDSGKNYQKPGFGATFLAFIIRMIPKIGPLKALSFRTPTPETEKMFMASFNTALDEYNHLLADVRTGHLWHSEL